MSKTITQKIIFKNTAAKDLYNLYLNAKLHSLSTGSAAKISDKEAEEFSAHDGYISGKNLQLIKNKLIVQNWRASDWSKDDMDSIFILHFETKGEDVILHMTHANVPDNQAENLASGWNDFYWKPWKKYLAGKLK